MFLLHGYGWFCFFSATCILYESSLFHSASLQHLWSICWMRKRDHAHPGKLSPSSNMRLVSSLRGPTQHLVGVGEAGEPHPLYQGDLVLNKITERRKVYQVS